MEIAFYWGENVIKETEDHMETVPVQVYMGNHSLTIKRKTCIVYSKT